VTNSASDLPTLADAKYRRWVSSEMRASGGRGFWLTCDRPFSEAATDLFLDAIRSNKPVPTVQRRTRPAPAHALQST
jgi:hypothetical protein